MMLVEGCPIGKKLNLPEFGKKLESLKILQTPVAIRGHITCKGRIPGSLEIRAVVATKTQGLRNRPRLEPLGPSCSRRQTLV